MGHCIGFVILKHLYSKTMENEQQIQHLNIYQTGAQTVSHNVKTQYLQRTGFCPYFHLICKYMGGKHKRVMYSYSDNTAEVQATRFTSVLISTSS